VRQLEAAELGIRCETVDGRAAANISYLEVVGFGVSVDFEMLLMCVLVMRASYWQLLMVVCYEVMGFSFGVVPAV